MLETPTNTEPTSPNPKEPSSLRTWMLLLRAHAAATHSISGRLQAEHGLSINDYETLSALAHAPDRRLRRVDVARWLLLTPSGVTRLLHRLEDAGFVERTGSDADLRVAYARITVAGAAKLEAAARNHAEAICALLEAHLSTSEIAQLGDMLGELSAA